MNIKTSIAAGALLCVCAAQAAETLLDVDFTKAPKSVNSSSLGSCTGVLPSRNEASIFRPSATCSGAGPGRASAACSRMGVGMARCTNS